MDLFKRLVRSNRTKSVCCFFSIFITVQACNVSAQSFPDHRIEMSVSYAAGGGTDAVARVIAAEMAKTLKQPIVVLNKVGAGGTLAVDHVAKSKPDGYSIGFFTGGPIILAPITETSLSYDPEHDLQPVSQIQTTDQVIVARNGLQADRIQELIAVAKQQPGKVTMGHTGKGTSQLLAAVMLEKFGHVKLNQIPYKGEAPMLVDIMGERVDVGLITATSAAPLLKSGKIKVISSGGSKRAYLFPQVPSMAESGFPKFEANSHMGIYAPAGTPADVIEKLSEAAITAVHQPEIQNQLRQMGGTPIGSNARDFTDFLREDRKRAESMLK